MPHINTMHNALLLVHDTEDMHIGTIGTLKQVWHDQMPALNRLGMPKRITLHNTSPFALDKARLEINKLAQQHDADAYEVLAHITPNDFGYEGGFGILLIALYKETL